MKAYFPAKSALSSFLLATVNFFYELFTPPDGLEIGSRREKDKEAEALNENKAEEEE